MTELSLLAGAAIDANAPLQDEHDPNGAPIDSDEEKDAVMAAIARSRPQPLVRHVAVPTRRLYQYVRMKETLSNALGGIRGQGLFAVGDAGRRTSTTAMDTDVIRKAGPANSMARDPANPSISLTTRSYSCVDRITVGRVFGICKRHSKALQGWLVPVSHGVFCLLGSVLRGTSLSFSQDSPVG